MHLRLPNDRPAAWQVARPGAYCAPNSLFDPIVEIDAARLKLRTDCVVYAVRRSMLDFVS
jgi:hypothetical protein